MAHDAVRARGALTRWLWPWLVFVQVFAQDAAVVIPRQIPRRVGITNHAPTPGAWVVHEVKMYFTETWTLLRGWGGCCCFVFFFLQMGIRKTGNYSETQDVVSGLIRSVRYEIRVPDVLKIELCQRAVAKAWKSAVVHGHCTTIWVYPECAPQNCNVDG